MVGDGEKRMAKILRESALKIINKTYEVINEELKKKWRTQYLAQIFIRQNGKNKQAQSTNRLF